MMDGGKSNANWGEIDAHAYTYTYKSKYKFC
jgi:hypothetical protein